MSAPWTPGPWRVSERYEPASGVIDSKGFDICSVDETCIDGGWQEKNPGKHWGSHGKDGSFIERRSDEVEANARLIAAAPDLYEACKALQMEAAARGCGLRIADEALAKARGEA